MPLLVYGLVRARHPDPPEDPAGVGDPPSPVRLVRAGQVAAAVSEIGDWTLRDEDALGYLDVLTGLLDAGPVLPVRFGTVAPDDDAVRAEILRPAAEIVAARLDELDGLVEVRIEVTADEDAELRDLLAGTPELRRMVQGGQGRGGSLTYRIDIGERVSEGLAERRAALDARVAATLRPLAVDYGSHTSDELTVLSQFYLIRAADLGRFDDAVQRLRSNLDNRYTVGYVGPLPPLDFTGDVERPPATGDSRGGSRWGW